MTYQNILVERQDRIAIITLNRPGVLNALSQATVNELDAAIDELGADESVRAIIITGAGEKAFAAGADMKELHALSSATEAAAFIGRRHRFLFKLGKLSKPVIAALNGYALGGGCELALACDIRIAAETARLGQPEINVGMIPGTGGTQRMLRLVGPGMARYLIMTGDHISAQEALRIGLVERVVPPEKLMDEAKALAAKLAAKPPIAIALAKQAIAMGMEMGLEDGCTHEVTLFGLVCATEDRLEGTTAFLEKRQPQFKGK
jgi:enoyl-CoA hydratase